VKINAINPERPHEPQNRPDGQISSCAARGRVQPHLQKYSDFPKTKISVELPPSTPLEGRIAIVTDAGLDAMDAAALLTKSANADGKTVWS
jgi:hypothetical protein